MCQSLSGRSSSKVHDSCTEGRQSSVSTEKALSSIAKQSEISFQEAMEHQSPPTTQEIEFTDVTHTLFAKQVEDEFLPSSFYIYKGIIANLTSWDVMNWMICSIISI